MTLRYTATQTDYQHAARLYYSSQRWTWIFLALFAGLFVLGLAALFSGSARLPGPALFSVMVLPLFVLFLVTTPQRLAQHKAKTAPGASETTWEIHEDYGIISGGGGTARLEWAKLDRAAEDSRCFLLFGSKNTNQFYMLPKRAFESAADLQAFRELLKRQPMRWL